MYGSDQPASVEPAGFTQLVGAVRKIEVAMGDGIKRIYKEEEAIANNLRQHLDLISEKNKNKKSNIFENQFKLFKNIYNSLPYKLLPIIEVDKNMLS